MTKCTFCNDRLRAGQGPACAELCPTGALSYADLPEEDITNVVEGFPSSQLGPAIKIVPWRDGLLPETSSASGAPSPLAPIPKRASLRTEWPLLAFTFIFASLFGALAAEVAGGVGVSAPIFLATAVLGLALSGAHVGRKLRTWRAILNVTRSWLSREVLFVGLFVMSGAIHLATAPEENWVGWVAIALGLTALFSMDMVYQFAIRPRPRVPHSASMVLTGPLLAGVLLLNPAFLAVFGSTKAILYCLRKVAMSRDGSDGKRWASAIRLGVGLIVPAALWLLDAQGFHGLIILGVLVGEFVDRAEFYSELDFTSPQRQMKIDLEARISLAAGTRSSKRPARS
jgi:DMSO reductase anchor subunit